MVTLDSKLIVDTRNKDPMTLLYRDIIFSMNGSILFMSTDSPFIFKVRPKDFKW